MTDETISRREANAGVTDTTSQTQNAARPAGAASSAPQRSADAGAAPPPAKGEGKQRAAVRTTSGKGRTVAVGPKRRPPEPQRQKMKARTRPRHWLVLLSFFLVVVGPAGYANWYLHEKAADMFASKLAFTIESDDSPILTGFEALLGGGSSGGSADKAEVLYGFIRSQNLVETLDERLDLRAVYNKGGEDWFFQLGPDAPIEDLVDYWQSVAIVSFAGGIVSVEVRAFTPEDAQRIASAVLDESTALINQMSEDAREDALRDARENLEEKEANLTARRRALAELRATDQIISPEIELPQILARIGELEGQLDIERIKLDELLQFAPSGDSRIVSAERRISTLESLIEQERRKLASASGSEQTMSESVGRFETATVDVEIAQAAYTAALASYESARTEARRQSIYLTAHIAPTKAETPAYPEKYFLGGLTTLFLFLGWVVLVMIGYNIKDRR